MSCRLAPGFKELLSGTGFVLLGFTITLVVWWVAASAIAFVFYCLIKRYEWYDLAAKYMPMNTQFDTLNDYLITCSLHAGHRWLLAFILISICVVIICGVGYEIRENYRYKADRLQYKFEGKRQPWYRVLISYIIVCDKTA